MITDVYFFNSDLTTYKNKIAPRAKNSLAIWYDGRSDLPATLLQSLPHIKSIYIEENIAKGLAEVLPVPKSIDLHVTPSSEKNSDNNLLAKVCVFPSNDTHAHLFSKLSQDYAELNFRTSPYKKESAEGALKQLGIESHFLDYEKIDNWDALLVGNDWGTFERHAVIRFQRRGIPTICLQESVIDLGTARRRMDYCDFPMIQGVATLKKFSPKILFLTGNPKYKKLNILPIPDTTTVLINSNFTYGVHEDIRDEWIRSCVEVCTEIKMPYVISQHPRDRGDYSNYHVLKSGAGRVDTMLGNSSILITRFSSLIHESLAYGRPVIYFNPHKENLGYDFEPDQRCLRVIYNKSDLKQAIFEATNLQLSESDFSYYLTRHCGNTDGKASLRISEALKWITSNAKKHMDNPPYWDILKSSLAFRRAINKFQKTLQA